MGIKGDSPEEDESDDLIRGADKLMKMELRVLDLIDFDLYVSNIEYN
jgi:hypothetical protein